jgi:hypothetical protein
VDRYDSIVIVCNCVLLISIRSSETISRIVTRPAEKRSRTVGHTQLTALINLELSLIPFCGSDWSTVSQRIPAFQPNAANPQAGAPQVQGFILFPPACPSHCDWTQSPPNQITTRSSLPKQSSKLGDQYPCFPKLQYGPLQLVNDPQSHSANFLELSHTRHNASALLSRVHVFHEEVFPAGVESVGKCLRIKPKHCAS